MRIGAIDVIESAQCLGPYELTEFTKELMGDEWVEKFDSWAVHALPKQPTCYKLAGNKFIAHPIIVDQLRKQVIESAKTAGQQWRSHPSQFSVCGMSDCMA